MINFLKANINHDILFILAELFITIGYIGSFIVITIFFVFHVKEEEGEEEKND